MRSLRLKLAALLCGLAPALSFAADDASALPSPAPAAPPGAVVVGQTTLDQARAVWSQGGAHILQSGLMSVGAGSGVDRAGTIAVDKVMLVDVSGVDFEGLPTARYAFYDKVLFAIQARLDTPFKENKSAFKALSPEDLDALEQKLRTEHGKPARELKDLYAGKKPDVLIWTIGPRELVLVLHPGLGSSLVLQDKALAKQADDSRKAVCLEHKPACGM